MQVTPLLAPQQSAVVVHFSGVLAQPMEGTHVNVGPPSAPVVWRQKPVQHWSPVSQLAPFCAHGSSANKHVHGAPFPVAVIRRERAVGIPPRPGAAIA